MLKGIQSERGVFRRLEFRKLNQIAKKRQERSLTQATHTHTHTHKEMGGGIME